MKITFNDVPVGSKTWARLQSLLAAAAEEGCETVCEVSAAKVMGCLVESGMAKGYMLKEEP